jgi:hypothetical protein
VLGISSHMYINDLSLIGRVSWRHSSNWPTLSNLPSGADSHPSAS